MADDLPPWLQAAMMPAPPVGPLPFADMTDPFEMAAARTRQGVLASSRSQPPMPEGVSPTMAGSPPAVLSPTAMSAIGTNDEKRCPLRCWLLGSLADSLCSL